VDSTPITDWVLREQNAKYQKDWEKYFKDVTRFNKDNAEQFKGSSGD
jgi:hypothetical protein